MPPPLKVSLNKVFDVRYVLPLTAYRKSYGSTGCLFLHSGFYDIGVTATVKYIGPSVQQLYWRVCFAGDSGVADNTEFSGAGVRNVAVGSFDVS